MISFTAVAPDDFAWIFRDREPDRRGLFPYFLAQARLNQIPFFSYMGSEFWAEVHPRTWAAVIFWRRLISSFLVPGLGDRSHDVHAPDQF